MTMLKVFTLGNHGFIGREVGDALGVRPHIRQARVLVVATNKTDAVRVLAEHGFPHHPPRDPEFRQAMGADLDTLTNAGELTQPGVWVLPSTGSLGRYVVRMQPGGEPQRIGRLEPGDDYKSVYVSEEQA